MFFWNKSGKDIDLATNPLQRESSTLKSTEHINDVALVTSFSLGFEHALPALNSFDRHL